MDGIVPQRKESVDDFFEIGKNTILIDSDSEDDDDLMIIPSNNSTNNLPKTENLMDQNKSFTSIENNNQLPNEESLSQILPSLFSQEDENNNELINEKNDIQNESNSRMITSDIQSIEKNNMQNGNSNSISTQPTSISPQSSISNTSPQITKNPKIQRTPSSSKKVERIMTPELSQRLEQLTTRFKYSTV